MEPLRQKKYERPSPVVQKCPHQLHAGSGATRSHTIRNSANLEILLQYFVINSVVNESLFISILLFFFYLCR